MLEIRVTSQIDRVIDQQQYISNQNIDIYAKSDVLLKNSFLAFFEVSIFPTQSGKITIHLHYLLLNPPIKVV